MREAVEAARQDNVPDMREGVPAPGDGFTGGLRVDVVPFTHAASAARYFLLPFAGPPPPAGEAAPAAGDARSALRA